MDAAAFKGGVKHILEAVLKVDPKGHVEQPCDFSNLQLPAVLKGFYKVASNSPELMESHHRFFPVPELENEPDGLIFCQENEGVVCWGIVPEHLDEEDPPVSQLNNTSPEWCEDCPRLSLFLLNMIGWQLLNAAPAVAYAQFEQDMLTAVSERMRPVCDKPDSYDLRVYYTDGAVACFLLPKLFYLAGENDVALAEWEHRLAVELEWI